MRGMTLLDELVPIARAAGAAILDVYATDFGVRSKGDASPVTEADERAEEVILERLAKLTPDIPIVSEEAASRGSIPETGRAFWLVDPLDGTKEFVNRNGEFTVNIALIEAGAPVLGVVLAPRWSASTAARGARARSCGIRAGAVPSPVPMTAKAGSSWFPAAPTATPRPSSVSSPAAPSPRP